MKCAPAARRGTLMLLSVSWDIATASFRLDQVAAVVLLLCHRDLLPTKLGLGGVWLVGKQAFSEL